VGPASDVFGLAAAAFHALTGVAPWNGATPADVLAVAAAGELPDLDELAPEAPAELRAVIARGLAADPHERGGAAAFALDLRHACRPEPVRLAVGPTGELQEAGAVPSVELTHQVPGRRPRPVPEIVLPARRRLPWPRGGRDRHDVGGHGRRSRGIAAAVVLAALLAGSAVWLLGRGGTPDAAAEQPPTEVAAPSEGSPAPTSTDAPASPPADAAHAVADPDSPAAWRALLDGLYAARAEAYGSASTEALDAVYALDSPLRGADAAEISRLRSTGAEVEGFAPEVVEVRSASRSAQRAEVRLVDCWPAYTVLARDGGRRAVPARGERLVAMVLVRGDDGWRIDSARLLS
jgi:hypothetical protein